MNRIELSFCSMSGDGDAIGTVCETPAGMRPRLGVASLPRWKPTVWGVVVVASALSTAGEATARLVAGGTVVAMMSIDLTAGRVISGEQQVDLSGVLGDAPLSIELGISTPTDPDVVLTMQGRLEINVPAQASGCVS